MILRPSFSLTLTHLISHSFRCYCCCYNLHLNLLCTMCSALCLHRRVIHLWMNALLSVVINTQFCILTASRSCWEHFLCVCVCVQNFVRRPTSAGWTERCLWTEQTAQSLSPLAAATASSTTASRLTSTRQTSMFELSATCSLSRLVIHFNLERISECK